MKYVRLILLLFVVLLVASSCSSITLKQEVPSSPKESYGELPK